jgi:hypothetical protein
VTILSSLLLAATVSACQVDSTPQSAVVVELFTSQGCSSCPPADRWLGTLRSRHGDRVIPLSMHVGYWDYIGWKDPFARREFNERQRLLAKASGSRNVYTPGVFVQGREFADWANAPRFDAAVRAAHRSSAAARVSLRAERAAADAVTVRAQADAPKGARLWLALVESGLSTSVRAGENRGETLRNDHVVREWRGPFEIGDVSQPLMLAPGTDRSRPAELAVVALVDDERGATLQAVRLPLAPCLDAVRLR